MSAITTDHDGSIAVELGTNDDESTLWLSLTKFTASRMLVTAMSGGGKSYALRKLIEVTAGKVGPQIVIDPEGEFYTLRDRHDHLLVGKAGDIPATVKTAPMLARELMATGASAVIDLSEMDEDEQRDYVGSFATAMISLPRELWRSALIVLDEAQIYIPEGGDDEVAVAVRRLMTRGRKRGLSTVLGTQRVSAIDKTAVAQCANVLVGQNTLDIDVDRCAKALGMRSADARRVLGDLEPGEFYVRGPALTRSVTKCMIGEVETRHPEPGHAMPTPAPAPAAMHAMIKRFTSLPDEAVAEAATVDELRAKVVDLERQLKARPEISPDREATIRAQESEKHAARFAELGAVIRQAHVAAGAMLESALEAAFGKATRPVPVSHPAVSPLPYAPPPRQPPVEVATHRPPPKPTRVIIDRKPAVTLTGPEQRIIDSLAWWENYTVVAPTLSMLAFRSGYSPKSSGFVKARSLCSAKGLIASEPGQRTRLTDDGRAVARGDRIEVQLIAQVISMLGGPEQRLLTALVNARGELSDEKLAALGGYSANSSGYIKARSHLCSLGLAERTRPGWTQAAPFLLARAAA